MVSIRNHEKAAPAAKASSSEILDDARLGAPTAGPVERVGVEGARGGTLEGISAIIHLKICRLAAQSKQPSAPLPK